MTLALALGCAGPATKDETGGTAETGDTDTFDCTPTTEVQDDLVDGACNGWLDEASLGVDVRTLPHTWMPAVLADVGIPFPTGTLLTVGEVDGRRVLAAGATYGFGVETLPSDGTWDTEWIGNAYELTYSSLAVGGWEHSIVASAGWMSVYDLDPGPDRARPWATTYVEPPAMKALDLDGDGLDDLSPRPATASCSHFAGRRPPASGPRRSSASPPRSRTTSRISSVTWPT